MKNLKVALIGNPNSGKTTIFNALTGYRHKTANYPGVTIEKNFGFKTYDGIKIEIVDLPGIYCLSAQSKDEKVARDYILNEKPDVVINIVDASNLEKSLFLTTQLMELNRPILLAINMIDIAEKRNIKIDLEFLQSILEIEAAALIANKKKGIDNLLKKVLEITKNKNSFGINVKFSPDIEKEITHVENHLPENIIPKEKRLFAIKLLEEDKYIQKKINSFSIIKKTKKSIDKLEAKYFDHVELILSRKRREFIRSILKKVYLQELDYKKNASDKIDEILTHKLFGLPIFLIIMYLIFQMTFFLGSYPMSWIENFFKFIISDISNIWPANAYVLLRSLFFNGIISGISSVIVFMPNIIILFFFISLLEDSGYIARAAFILDRLMHKIGLHGKSFIPMLIGFGCSVPAIMATRFIESKKDRIITILSLPLIACSAKLVVFTLIIPAFFERKFQAIILFSLYTIGIMLAIFFIKTFKRVLFKGPSFSFVMELPSYKIPSFFGACLHMWDKAEEYVKKAGTLILGFSIILWALTSFPENKKNVSDTYLARFGKGIEPIFKPLGFDWKIDTSLISSLASKEVFVAQLGIIYSNDNKNIKDIKEHLKKDYSKLQSFCIMLFVLISTPCIATLAITKKETASYKWAIFQFIYLTIIAYFVTFLFYQTGLLFFRVKHV